MPPSAHPFHPAYSSQIPGTSSSVRSSYNRARYVYTLLLLHLTVQQFSSTCSPNDCTSKPPQGPLLSSSRSSQMLLFGRPASAIAFCSPEVVENSAMACRASPVPVRNSLIVQAQRIPPRPCQVHCRPERKSRVADLNFFPEFSNTEAALLTSES